jgi:hypothetical protein
MAAPASRERISSIPAPDPYLELLSRTREMRSEQRAARDTWFQQLQLDAKEEVLFELEILLKACACYSNPRNHPGPPRTLPVVAQDFREATLLFRDGLQRAADLTRRLLGERDRAFVFHRYLETMLPEDSARTQLAREGSEQSRPEQSLVALRLGLTSNVEVVEGVLRAQRVPFRLFFALTGTLQREIGRNTFFNPLTALEFRPEFDRIRSGEVLDLIHSVPGSEARRLVALTFLSLFRMLRYLQLIERIAAESAPRRRSGARACFVLSVLRSDARALSDHLRHHAGTLLASSFEQDIFRVSAGELRSRAPALRTGGHRLLAIRAALDGVAASLRLELRRAFQHDLPSVDAVATGGELRSGLLTAIGNLRPALRNSVLFLGKALGVSLEAGGVFDDETVTRETSERLRRDIWMFAQIVRAFATKARHSSSEDRWAAAHNLAFVREFLAYFRAMGYPLLRSTDYPRFDAFMSAMDGLQDTDLVDPARLKTAIGECLAFTEFLQGLFDSISRRDVLRGVEFDRRGAAAALRLYVAY